MDSKSFSLFKKQFDKAQEIREFKKMLKENPIQEHELQQLILGSDLEQDVKMQIWKQKDVLKKDGLVIDTIPPTFEQFSESAEKEGLYPIRASELKQASQGQFNVIKQVKFALFDDVGGNNYVNHYRYKDTRGFPQKTG